MPTTDPIPTTTDHLDRLLSFKHVLEKPRVRKRRPRAHSTHMLDGMYEHDKRNVEIWFDKHWNDDAWREALIERVRNPESIIL